MFLIHFTHYAHHDYTVHSFCKLHARLELVAPFISLSQAPSPSPHSQCGQNDWDQTIILVALHSHACWFAKHSNSSTGYFFTHTQLYAVMNFLGVIYPFDDIFKHIIHFPFVSNPPPHHIICLYIIKCSSFDFRSYLLLQCHCSLRVLLHADK